MRPIKSKTVLLPALTLAIFLSAFAGMAVGSNALQPRDIVCRSSHVFVAEVLGARSGDCRRRYPDARSCGPTDLLHLSLRIGEMLASDDLAQSHAFGRDLRSGDLVEVQISVANRLPRTIGGVILSGPSDEYGMLKANPPTGQSLSDEEISTLVLSKNFIFGISLNARSRPTEIPYANVWPVALGPWVRDSLRTPSGRKCLGSTG
jgi:hypothetical protein